jgi:hypothetical protein
MMAKVRIQANRTRILNLLVHLGSDVRKRVCRELIRRQKATKPVRRSRVARALSGASQSGTRLDVVMSGVADSRRESGPPQSTRVPQGGHRLDRNLVPQQLAVTL